MKALVIAPQPFFTPRGTPFSVYYRTLVTAEHDVKVDLLTYSEGQDVDLPGVRLLRGPRFAFLGNVKIGPSALKLFLDCFLILRTMGLLLANRYDFVHAHEEAVFFCRFLKPIFRFKLVYDMHSSLPQMTATKLMARALVLASPRTEGENTQLKVYELLASGKPFFATSIYSHTQVLTSEVAFMVEPTAQGISDGMIESAGDNDEVRRRITNAQQLYQEKYSCNAYESKLRILLDRLKCVA